MESEKVKEIKKALKNCQKNNCLDCLYFIDEKMCRANDLLFDTITLINELESENEKLKNEYLSQARLLGQMGYNDIQECKKLQDRIADLEKVYDRQVRIINDLHIEVVKEQEKLPKFAERLKERGEIKALLVMKTMPRLLKSIHDEIVKSIDETLKAFIGEE